MDMNKQLTIRHKSVKRESECRKKELGLYRMNFIKNKIFGVEKLSSNITSSLPIKKLLLT